MSTSDKETYMELLMVEEEKNKQLQAENKELRKALEFEKTKDRHMIGINKVLTNNAQKELDERSKLQAENKWLLELAKLRDDLCVCYRIGKWPSEKLLDRLEVLRKKEQALKEGE